MMENQATAKDDEDLDYHITFPRPGQDAMWVEREVPATQLEPVIFLLGWASCKDYNLVKYGQIYEERCITIRYTAPLNLIFMQLNGLESTAKKLWELLLELGLEENPVFIHAFSNQGGILYHQMVRTLNTSPCFAAVRLKGCILDSLPSPRRPYIAAKAVYLSVTYNVIIRFLLAAGVFIFLYVASAVEQLLRVFGVTADITNLHPWISLHEIVNFPQLYLYSKADELVPYFYIEKHIHVQTGHNHRVDVWSKCWPDSSHVQHFKLYEDEYTTICQRFVQHCLMSTGINS